MNRTKAIVMGARGVAAVMLLCLWPALAFAQEESGAEIKAQAEQVLDAGDMQRSTPTQESIRSEAAATAQDPTLQHDPPTQQPLPPLNLPIPGTAFLYFLLAIMAVCLCLVAYHLFRTYAPSRSTKSGERALEVAAQALRQPGEAPIPELDEIERLARAGAYAEAIHLMLLRALDALRRRLGINWAKSLTSREIVRRVELGPTDRRSLKMLVGAVEISRFGGQSANEQIYRDCLDHYRLIGGEGKAAQA